MYKVMRRKQYAQGDLIALKLQGGTMPKATWKDPHEVQNWLLTTGDNNRLSY